jgi:hypothetical protein
MDIREQLFLSKCVVNLDYCKHTEEHDVPILKRRDLAERLQVNISVHVQGTSVCLPIRVKRLMTRKQGKRITKHVQRCSEEEIGSRVVAYVSCKMFEALVLLGHVVDLDDLVLDAHLLQAGHHPRGVREHRGPEHLDRRHMLCLRGGRGKEQALLCPLIIVALWGGVIWILGTPLVAPRNTGSCQMSMGPGGDHDS